MVGVDITQCHALQTLPQLTLRPSPALITATALLALPSFELEQAVARELADNPALERVDGGVCHRCGRSLAATGCHACERPRRSLSAAAGGDGAAEPAARPAPAEALLGELAPLLGRGERAVAVYLLGSLDERGFLDTTVEEAAAALAVEPRVVARVLGCLQTTAPAGIAARDLRECLLLQLERCQDGGRARELARRIIADHLPLLGGGRYGELARLLGVDRADVLAARDFVRARLQPRPGLGLPPVAAVADQASELARDLVE